MSIKQDKSVRSNAFLIKHLKHMAENGFLEIIEHEENCEFVINLNANWTLLSENDRFAYVLFRIKKDMRGRVVERSDKQLSRYILGGDIPLSVVASAAKASSINLQWIIDGNGEPYSDLDEPNSGDEFEPTTSSKSLIQIPRYDVHLSAGDGHWNEDNVTVLDHIPYTQKFLQKILNRKSISDLLILEVSGDSMLPTISDGDLVLVDKRALAKNDGIFAYVQDGLARVKRFRFLSGGGLEIVSDNRDIYSPELLSNADAEELTIIGRICWIGHTV